MSTERLLNMSDEGVASYLVERKDFNPLAVGVYLSQQ